MNPKNIAAFIAALGLAVSAKPAPAHPGHSAPSPPAAEEERLAVLIESFEKRLAESPDNPLILTQLGALHLKKAEATGAHGDFAKAAERFRQHLELTPGSANSHFGLARALAGRHRFREALEQAEEASRLVPKEPVLKVYVGDCHFWLGEYGEAEAIYLAHHDEEDLTVESLGRLAQIAEVRGRDAQALTHWRDACGVGKILSDPPARLSPAPLAWAKTMLGDFWLARNNPAAAEARFREALAITPDAEAAQWRLARALARQDKHREAYDLLVRLAARHERAEYWLDAARSAEALGEDPAPWAALAERNIVEAWENDGELGHVRYLIDYWTEKEINLDRAAEFALLDLKARGDIGACQAAAWALHKAGRTEEALPVAEKALAPGSRTPRLARQMAAIYEAAGHPERAREIRQEAKAALESLPPAE